MPILELNHLAKSYGPTTILHDVTLAVEPGDFMVIYGTPSSGKSVLVRLLTGLERPDRGGLILRGQDLTHASAGERNIGYVPQSFALYPHMNVYKNIAYPLTLARLNKRGDRTGGAAGGRTVGDCRAAPTQTGPTERRSEAAGGDRAAWSRTPTSLSSTIRSSASISAARAADR
ncbi:MAG: ATP-binding cassette domain-containing protein [Caldilineaceae bacterium]